MDGLISLLLFAGFFYLMMRFGCGAHMVHGGHGKSGGRHTGDVTHIDPVCGIQISPEEGYGKMHDGSLYRFCSRGCLDRFEGDPDRYTVKAVEMTP